LFEKWQNAQRRGIFSPDKAKIRRNTLCISRIFNAVWRKKDRRLSVLTFFKQGLMLLFLCFYTGIIMTLWERLYAIIRRIGEQPERYARNPGKAFTRKQALTPAVLIHLILTMDEKGIWKGLLGHFHARPDTPWTAPSLFEHGRVRVMRTPKTGVFASSARYFYFTLPDFVNI